jgi:hypothetical protein
VSERPGGGDKRLATRAPTGFEQMSGVLDHRLGRRAVLRGDEFHRHPAQTDDVFGRSPARLDLGRMRAKRVVKVDLGHVFALRPPSLFVPIIPAADMHPQIHTRQVKLRRSDAKAHACEKKPGG